MSTDSLPAAPDKDTFEAFRDLQAMRSASEGLERQFEAAPANRWLLDQALAFLGQALRTRDRLDKSELEAVKTTIDGWATRLEALDGSPVTIPGSFDGLDAMREAHNTLLLVTAGSPPVGRPREWVVQFLHSAAKAGEKLKVRVDRSEAQALLGYWLSVLYTPPFDPSVPIPTNVVLAEYKDSHETLSNSQCPYAGLNSFGEEQRGQFYGRGDALRALEERLARQPLVALVGEAGDGRSSLVNAGLLPRLRAGEVPGIPRCRIFVVMPGKDPIGALATAVQRPESAAGESAADFRDQLVRSPDALRERLDTPPGQPPAVLVVERGSELFTQCEDQAAREQFAAAIFRLTEGTPRHRVILHLRADYYQALLNLPALKGGKDKADLAFRLPPPTPTELREMIEKPADRVGLAYAPGLINQLVRQVAGEPIALPILQFTLQKLWDAREGNLITWKAYHRVGTPRDALQRTAEEVYQSLSSDAHRDVARRVFSRLIRPSVSQQYVEHRMHREALRALGPAHVVDNVLEQFAQAGLLRERSGKEIEVAHEVLARCWARLAGWLAEDRQRQELRFKMEAMREVWEAKGRDPQLLLGNQELLEDLSRQFLDLSLPDQEYLKASQKYLDDLREKAKRRLKRNQRMMTAIIALLSLCLLFLSGMLYYRAVAHRIEKEARTRGHISRGNAALQAGDASGALLWYREAAEETVERPPSPAHAQRAALQYGQLPSVHFLHTRDVSGGSDDKDKRLVEARLSPDGEWLALADRKGVYLAPAGAKSGKASPLEAGPVQAGGIVSSLAFSPDGNYLLAVYSTEDDQTPREARLWAIDRGGGRQIRFPCDGVRYAAFRPAAQAPYQEERPHWLLLTARQDPKEGMLVEAWMDVRPGSLSRRLPNHGGSTFRFGALSPDGRKAMTAVRMNEGSAWDVARVWVWGRDGSGLQDALPLTPPEGGVPIVNAAFTPDSRLLFTVHLQQNQELGEAAVWDLKDPRQARLVTRRPQVRNMAFSPDGRHLVTAGDPTALIYRLEPDSPRADNQAVFVATLRHQSSVFMASFSPDGRRVVTGSRDPTMRVWDVTTGKPLLPSMYHDATVAQAVFSPDGRRVLCRTENSVLLWDLATHNPPPTVHDLPEPIGMAALSAEGTKAVASEESEGGEGRVRLWDAEAEPWDLPGLAGATYVALRPDGKRLAAVVQDKTKRGEEEVQIWPCTRGAKDPEWRLRPKGTVVFAAFAAGDKLITVERVSNAKKSENGDYVRIWDLKTGTSKDRDRFQVVNGALAEKQPDGTQPQYHLEPVNWAAVHGNRVITGGNDDVAIIWDLTTGKLMKRLVGHTANVNCVAFSPTGHRVVTGSADGGAKLWNLEGELLGTVQHGAFVTHASFSDDGRRLATAGMDGMVRVWFLTEPIKADVRVELLGVLPHHGRLVQPQFRSDGIEIVTMAVSEPPPSFSGVGQTTTVSRGGQHALVYQWGLAIQAGINDLAAQLVAGRKYDKDEGRLAPLPVDQLAELWRKPEVATDPHPRGRQADAEWHEAQAREAAATGQWSGAAWHLTALLDGRDRPAESDRGRLRDLQARRARVFAALGLWKKVEADCSRGLPLGPGGDDTDVELYQLRARSRGEQGQYEKALEDIRVLLDRFRKELTVNRATANLDHANTWYWCAMAQLALGDHGAYRKTCEEMVGVFGGCTNSEVCNRVAWGCAVAPGGLGDAEAYMRLYRRTEDVMMKNKRHREFRFRHTLAALRYRQGTCTEGPAAQSALSKAREALGVTLDTYRQLQTPWVTLPPTNAQRKYLASLPPEERARGTFWDQVFLAMAHHHTSDTKGAEEWLTEAEKRWKAVDANIALRSEMTWTARLAMEQLLTEARSLIRKPAPAKFGLQMRPEPH